MYSEHNLSSSKFKTGYMYPPTEHCTHILSQAPSFMQGGREGGREGGSTHTKDKQPSDGSRVG